MAIKTGIPCLYFSADSDAFTQLSRMISILTGTPMERSLEMVREGDISGVADKLDLPIRFNFTASPEIDDVELEMAAYAEVYEAYPALVIVDNITNLRTGGDQNNENPFDGLESLLEFLHDMARSSGAHVCGLHHVVGPFNDSAYPIPLSGVKGQIGRVPEVILTMHRDPRPGTISDLLNVSTVKNRAGRADPSGYGFAELNFNANIMDISDNKRGSF